MNQESKETGDAWPLTSRNLQSCEKGLQSNKQWYKMV